MNSAEESSPACPNFKLARYPLWDRITIQSRRPARLSRPPSPLTPTPKGKYQNPWGQAAMASSLRDWIHRLPDQKITLTHLPAQIWEAPKSVGSK